METPCSAPAWDGLEEHRADLCRRLRARCRDESEVDDLVQETFLRAARYRRSLGDPTKLRAWLLQIAGNVHRDLRRRERRWRVCEPGEEWAAQLEGREPPPEETLDGPELRFGSAALELGAAQRHVARALARLDEHDRRVLEGFYGEGGSARRAAARVGVPQQAVKVRLFRARRRLRQAVGRSLRLELGLAVAEVRA